jgi:1-deoxy-D-xylulose-5-phosphate synthase
MALLESINGLEDVKRLPRERLPELCDEIRQRLIDVVSTTGGHIGAGLGVVELATALAVVFDSPRDRVVWDVGHQAYPWKILTGRNARFPTLRQQGGISGFLRRDESPHDHFGAGHAGTAMSAAFGMAVARDLRDEHYDVVAVVGDGAMTCGLSYEGMNNAGHSGRDLIVILNDNGMSIAPNVGAISRYLASITTNPLYNRIREELKRLTLRVDAMVGHGVQEFARRAEESLKNLVLPGVLFQEMGLRYFGPVDGHDVKALVEALENLRQLKGPRLLHVLTQKGKGFPFETPDLEKFHSRAPYDPATGELRAAAGGPPSWTKVFGDAIAQLGAEHSELVAITAAMPSGTGTNAFQRRWPDRFFDVGIAEGHATTFAAGLATQGIRPVVAIYSTFLQRAYDNIIHDVAIQKLPVIFCLDRAGMVGDDGQTHMGLYDIAYLLAVPGMTLTAPRDGDELIGLLRCAMAWTQGPFAIRYPRDTTPSVPSPVAEVPAVPYGTWEVLRRGKDVALMAVGAMCVPAMAAAETLAAEGLDVSVVNCRFLKPVDRATLDAVLRTHQLLVTVEDGIVANGFGAYLAEVVQASTPGVRVVAHGAPDRTYEHAPRAKQLAAVGLDAHGIAARVRALHSEEAALPS